MVVTKRKYRPEGWENPFKKTVEDANKSYPNGIPKGYHVLQEAGRSEGFEAGADAMLEGLKEDYLCKVDLVGAASTTKEFLAKLLGKKGYLVFIPEENIK